MSLHPDTKPLSKTTLKPFGIIIDRSQPTEIVLGGGAARGISHCGFLKAIAETDLEVGVVTGVSIGSLIATFYTNGYQPDQIAEIFMAELAQLPAVQLTKTLVLPRWLERLSGGRLGGGLLDLEKLFRGMIEKYQLRPQPNLRIIAYNLVNRLPVIFEGTDYDLLTALTASCAIPLVMRPVWYGQKNVLMKAFTLIKSVSGKNNAGVLVDGGVHHPYPGDFCRGPAIISKLGFASQPSRRRLPLAERLLHRAEMLAAPWLEWYFQRPKGHLVIDVGVPDVACLTFALPRPTCLRMVEHAYRVSQEALAQEALL